ncbi:hypothetical protein [Phenylobacterium sp.]|uniref:hypothetical protein n=1 Tax=Phenylobacterium sp. TaxID=1871053 RepID=UPI00286A7FC0|nr:hypothetical protein [Phenylobacterium sp.]
MSIRPRSLRFRLALSSALLLTLTACRGEDRPQAAAGPLFVPAESAAYDPGLAPEWSDLPRQEASLGRPTDDGYSYAERAYEMDRAFYQSPPDYAFSYDDAQPWVWESQDDWRMYAEPLKVGYRYYYYEPGEPYPYFVRDPDYGYGYDQGGLLVTVYDSRGALLPAPYLSRNADRAGRYLARARTLRDASASARRITVTDERWVNRRSSFVANQANWFEAARRQPDWTRHRATNESNAGPRFERERERRADSIARLDRVEARQEPRRDDRGPRVERRDRQIAEASPMRVERPVRADDRRRDRDSARGDRDDRQPQRRAEEARPRPQQVEVAKAPPQPGAPARADRQDRREDRRRAERPQTERPAVTRAERQPEARPARVERQAQRDDRRPERPAREARERPERQAAAPAQRVERQARNEPARADQAAPRPQEARNVAQAGKDAGGRERRQRDRD